MPRDFYKKENFSKLASERAKTIKHRNEIWRKMLRERCFTAMAEKETIPISSLVIAWRVMWAVPQNRYSSVVDRATQFCAAKKKEAFKSGTINDVFFLRAASFLTKKYRFAYRRLRLWRIRQDSWLRLLLFRVVLATLNWKEIPKLIICFSFHSRRSTQIF